MGYYISAENPRHKEKGFSINNSGWFIVGGFIELVAPHINIEGVFSEESKNVAYILHIACEIGVLDEYLRKQDWEYGKYDGNDECTEAEHNRDMIEMYEKYIKEFIEFSYNSGGWRVW